jgi:hypothetical protein
VPGGTQQLGVVIEHFLKVGCTTQYVWVSVDSTVGTGPGFQHTKCKVIAWKGDDGLPAHFSREFRGGSLQIASPATLLEDGDSFGWQSSGDLGKRVSRHIRKPT